MDEKHVRENDPGAVRTDEDLRGDAARADVGFGNDAEPSASHDIVEGGAIGVVGGAIVGGLAGGVLGAVIGAVAAGAVGAAGVAMVDRRDHDYRRVEDEPRNEAGMRQAASGSAAQGVPPASATETPVPPPVGAPNTYASPSAAADAYADPIAPKPSPYLGEDAPFENPELTGTYSGGHNDYTGDYRNHFEMVYGATGASYGEFDPAYRYGDRLANDSRFHTGEWDSVERFAQPEWEARHEGTWERFKESIRYGWERARESFADHKHGVYRDADAKPRNIDPGADAKPSAVDPELRPADLTADAEPRYVDPDADAELRHLDADVDESEVDENHPAGIG